MISNTWMRNLKCMDVKYGWSSFFMGSVLGNSPTHQLLFVPPNQGLWRFAWSCMDMCRATRNWSCLARSLQLRSSKTMLSLIVSAFIMVQCPFRRLFGATFFAFLCFLLAISLFKKAPKCRAKVLSRAPTCLKPRTRFAEKTQALDKF